MEEVDHVVGNHDKLTAQAGVDRRRRQAVIVSDIMQVRETATHMLEPSAPIRAVSFRSSRVRSSLQLLHHPLAAAQRSAAGQILERHWLVDEAARNRADRVDITSGEATFRGGRGRTLSARLIAAASSPLRHLR